MDTNLCWMLIGRYEERKTTLQEMPRELLEAAILDVDYNDFVVGRSNYNEDETDKHGHGKRVPYIGWFWSHITFHDLTSIAIGDCGEFIGFIPNSNWDYPRRRLTEAEGRKVVEIIDAARFESQQGGNVKQIIAKTNAKLGELWEYMQTLRI